MAEFRASIVDQGRTLWLEELPVLGQQAAPEASSGADEPTSSSAVRAPTSSP
jgi:hypothetical protein